MLVEAKGYIGCRLLPYFVRQGISLNLELTRLDWLATALQGLPVAILQAPGITGVSLSMACRCWEWNSVLILVSQAFSHLPNFICFVLVFERLSLRSPCWPQTHYVEEARSELTLVLLPQPHRAGIPVMGHEWRNAL